MKPKDFKESNVTLTRPGSLSDIECGSLNVFTDGKQCISLWKPSFRERISILIYGRVWLSVWSGRTQPPIWIDGSKEAFNQAPIRVKVALFLNRIISLFSKKS